MGPLTRKRSLCTLETWLWGQLRTQHQKQTIGTTLFGTILGQILLPFTFIYFRVIYYEQRELPTSPHLHLQQCPKPEKTSRIHQRCKEGKWWISLEIYLSVFFQSAVADPWSPSKVSLQPSAHQNSRKPKPKSHLEQTQVM